MAPITRKTATLSDSKQLPNALHDGFLREPKDVRDISFKMTETPVQTARSDSDDPSMSYNNSDGLAGSDDGSSAAGANAEVRFTTSGDHDDVLHPLRDVADRVGSEVERFAEILDKLNVKHNTDEIERKQVVAEALERYHEVAQETLKRLRKQHRKRQDLDAASARGSESPSVHDADAMDVDVNDPSEPNGGLQTTVEDLERWEREVQTWSLVRRLVAVRYDEPAVPTPAQDLSHASEAEIWRTFLGSNGVAREQNVILRWLEDTADDTGEEIDTLVQHLQQQADRGDMFAHGWLHTKEAIKKTKRLHDWTDDSAESTVLMSSAKKRLVIHLDPDAPSREARSLEPQDEAYERAIWLGCYHLLRRGSHPNNIREWCQDRTEIWRAIGLGAHHGRYEQTESSFVSISSKMLWKRMCFSLARKGATDDHERAVYGLLCGDLESVEPVCESWDDLVYAHYNAYLEAQFASYTQSLYSQRILKGTDTVFAAVDAGADPKQAMTRFLDTLRADSRTSSECDTPLKHIQAMLVQDHFVAYAVQQGAALGIYNRKTSSARLYIRPEDGRKLDVDAASFVRQDNYGDLRVVTHMLIIYQQLGIAKHRNPHDEELAQNIIAAYVDFLRLSGKEDLIPLYCSQLAADRYYEVLSRSLIDVIDDSRRQNLLNSIRRHDMDVFDFVECQTRALLDDNRLRSPECPARKDFRLLEPASGKKDRRKGLIKGKLTTGDIEEVDRLDLQLIRSLEWCLLVDGMWHQVFRLGIEIYFRFFKQVHLQSARLLSIRLSSNKISMCKTRAILGDSIDIFSNVDEQDDFTEIANGSSEKHAMILHAMREVGQPYRHLESLALVLEHVEIMAERYHSVLSGIIDGPARQSINVEFTDMHSAMPPLLKNWLLLDSEDTDRFHQDARNMREIYLPEVILAYINTLTWVGEALTRERLLECMDLASEMARDGSDLFTIFVQTRRLQEAVDAFALASQTLLLSNAKKLGPSTRPKKLRAKGWTHDLWTVAPPVHMGNEQAE